MKMSEDELRLEEEHLAKVLRVIRHDYQSACHNRLGKYYRDAPTDCAQVCPEYLKRLARIGDAISVNQRALRVMTDAYGALCDDPQSGGVRVGEEERAVFVENCKSLLRQLVREWSVEGRQERQVYQWIIDKVNNHYRQHDGVRVLVPGAGLGRLAWELARHGYAVQANEFSNFMLLPSEYLLNRCHDHVVIHPFLFPLSNTVSEQDQLRAVTIPDTFPAAADSAQINDFSYIAGDFTQVYSSDEYHQHFDAVAACFFLDTAKNIIEYVKIIHRILKPAGLLVNCGPLLYHFEGSLQEPSVELTLDEVKLVLGRVGFEMVEETWMESTYVQNGASLLSSVYKCHGSVWRRLP